MGNKRGMTRDLGMNGARLGLCMCGGLGKICGLTLRLMGQRKFFISLSLQSRVKGKFGVWIGTWDQGLKGVAHVG